MIPMLVLAGCVLQNPETPQGERLYREVRILQPWLVHAASEGSKAPALVCLHGKGGTISGMAAIWGMLTEPRPFALFPEAPYPFPLSGNPPTLGWSWDFPSSDKALWAKADPWVVDYVLDAVREARRRTGREVYLLGHSQGVAYAYLAALKEPNLVRGVIAFAGVLPIEMIRDEAFAAAAGRVRVFIAHGDEDKAIGVEASQKAQRFLERRGWEVTLRVFQGGHGIDPRTLREAQAWMASSK